jgi:hypothetical protein
MYAVVGVLAAVVIVAVVVVVAVAGGGSSSASSRKAATPAEVGQVQSISMQTLTSAVGRVGPQNLNYASTAAGGTLTSAGKPQVLFIGAEFCPICAAERWPMTIALMKFGTFTNLQTTHSAVADGNAGTWSYEGATYTSKYLTFTPYELYTNQPSGNYYKKLDNLPSGPQGIWTANQGSNLTFPFIDFGGKEVLESAQYNPSVIYYHNFTNVLNAVGNNDNSIGAYVDASAAVFVKYLCGVTNGQPGDVCSAVANVQAPVTASKTGSSSPAGG